MKHTPRTDAVAQRVKHISEVTEIVRANFARELESELSEEKAHHTRTDQKWQRDYNQAVAERIKETNRADAKDALIAQLREALQKIMPFVADGYIEIPPIKKAAYDALAATPESEAAELTALRKDKLRIDWLDQHVGDLEVRIHTADAIHRYAPIFGEMGGACPFRTAIDSARKATP